jgi:hypothetical protein
MTRITRLIAPLAVAAALSLGACSGEADIDVDADSTAGDDTVTLTPADSGMPSNAGGDTSNLANEDTTTAISPDDTTSAGGAVSDAASGAANEGVEKLVEAQLMISPGFSDVKVESEGDGRIVLSGTVASAEEKASAEAEAKKIVGVKSVKNNLTVK